MSEIKALDPQMAVTLRWLRTYNRDYLAAGNPRCDFLFSVTHEQFLNMQVSMPGLVHRLAFGPGGIAKMLHPDVAGICENFQFIERDIGAKKTINVWDVIKKIDYKPGWLLGAGYDFNKVYLQWSFSSQDYTVEDRCIKPWTSRKWYLSEHMTESEIVQTALAAAIMAEEHETREAFTYMGKHIFNPHISLAAMLQACESLEVRA